MLFLLCSWLFRQYTARSTRLAPNSPQFELIIFYHTILGNLVFKMQCAFDHMHYFILHSSEHLLLAKYFFSFFIHLVYLSSCLSLMFT